MYLTPLRTFGYARTRKRLSRTARLVGLKCDLYLWPDLILAVALTLNREPADLHGLSFGRILRHIAASSIKVNRVFLAPVFCVGNFLLETFFVLFRPKANFRNAMIVPGCQQRQQRLKTGRDGPPPDMWMHPD
jgi:hypothetical protein